MLGLVFDFDGLILDTELPDYQAWQEIYVSFGCDLPLRLWTSHIGKGSASIQFNPYEYLEEQLGRPIDRTSIRARRRARYMELVESKDILPGVLDYISDARRLGLRIGLASSSPREWVVGHLTRLGLFDYFECVRCADDVEHTKPEPDVYRAVLGALNLPAHRTLALEDSPNGILAAKRADMICVAVPNSLTRGLSLEGADLVLSSLADLPLTDLLAEVSGGLRKEQRHGSQP